MSQLFNIHLENPQPRLITHTAEILRDGGVIAYPTDSGYALGCMLGFGDAQAVSYTHLDVYKRQNMASAVFFVAIGFFVFLIRGFGVSFRNWVFLHKILQIG